VRGGDGLPVVVFGGTVSTSDWVAALPLSLAGVSREGRTEVRRHLGGHGRGGCRRRRAAACRGGVELPGVLGGVGGLGVWPGTGGARAGRCRGAAASAPVSLRWVRGDACVVAGGGVAAPGGSGVGDRGALAAKAAGAGHRRIARAMGRPAETVHGWLRCFAVRAEAVRGAFTRWIRALAPDPVMPASAGGCGRGRMRLRGSSARRPRWRTGSGCSTCRCGKPRPRCRVGGCWRREHELTLTRR
jgi:hypothetical protein